MNTQFTMPDFNDAPIDDASQDRFGFDPFARTIARCILGLDRHVGSVVAIYGAWGSGKSSVINLVRRHLEQADNAPVVVPIQAWWYRTEDALAVGFFQELYAALQRELPKDRQEKAKNALAALGGHIAGAGPLLGAAVGLVAGSAVEGAVNAVSSTLANYIRTDENTEQLQKEVADALAQQEKRFLFVVDDLDRLSPEEVLVVLRLIKSVGRLPNVAYLLSYDRELTERVVAKHYPSEGAHYLEKIVQAGFELPEPDPLQLRELFMEQLKLIWADASVSELVGSDDIESENLLHEAVFPELQTPRDVVRLAYTVSITWSAIRGEVHVGDFLALEALRLFRPSVYRALRISKNELTGTGREYGHEVNDLAARLETRLVGEEPEHKRPRLKRVLMRLFPRLEAVWENSHHGSVERWVRSRRACTDEHFNTYFVYSLPDTTVSRVEIQELIANAADIERVQSIFREAVHITVRSGRTRSSYLLEALCTYAEEVRREDATPLLSALFGIADELMVESDAAGAFAYADNSLRLHWLLRQLTFKRMSLVERSDTLIAAMQNASISWLADFTRSAYGDYHPREGEEPELEEKCLTTSEDLKQLVALFLARVTRTAEDMSLARSPHLARILFIWERLKTAEENGPREWTSGLLDDESCLPVLARAFLGQSWSQELGGPKFGGLGDLVARKFDRATIKDAEAIIDLDRFESRLQEVLRKDEMKPKDRDIISRLLAVWDNYE
jgi:predicted KAP-like P-loop ATPase